MSQLVTDAHAAASIGDKQSRHTTSYWFPDRAFGAGGIGLFETPEVVETIEISLYLIGVSAFARGGEDLGARLCAEAYPGDPLASGVGTPVTHTTPQ